MGYKKYAQILSAKIVHNIKCKRLPAKGIDKQAQRKYNVINVSAYNA
jgi:hypothetical protein